MNETKRASLIRTLDGFSGDARLYRVEPPVRYGYNYATQTHKGTTEFVVVSAATVMFSGPETYIFAADEAGKVIDWTELGGSFKGGLDHEEALDNAGYTIVREEAK